MTQYIAIAMVITVDTILLDDGVNVAYNTYRAVIKFKSFKDKLFVWTLSKLVRPICTIHKGKNIPLFMLLCW